MKKQLFIVLFYLICSSIYGQGGLHTLSWEMAKKSEVLADAIGVFPGDMDTETLLISQSGRKMWDNAVNKPIEKNYPFKYEKFSYSSPDDFYKQVDAYKAKGYKYILEYTSDLKKFTKDYLDVTKKDKSGFINFYTAYIRDINSDKKYLVYVNPNGYLKKAVEGLIENVKTQYNLK